MQRIGKTALQLLGQRRFKRYRRYHFLRAEDITGEERYISLDDLILAMKHNYAFYACEKKFLGCHGGSIDANWNLLYDELVSKSIYELEMESATEYLTEGIDKESARYFA